MKTHNSVINLFSFLSLLPKAVQQVFIELPAIRAVFALQKIQTALSTQVFLPFKKLHQ